MNVQTFKTLLQSGQIEPNAMYTLDGMLVFDGSDKGKIFDFKNAALEFPRSTDSAVRIDISDITLLNARIYCGGSVGVLVNASDCLIEECTVEGAGIGVSVNGHDVSVVSCRIEGCRLGIYGSFEKSEISACMGRGYNILLAKNALKNEKTDIILENVSNVSVVNNTFGAAKITGCTNAYVIENRVSDSLSLIQNGYLIANANNVRELTATDNTNVNGDNITDLSERAQIGANEKLLPHINSELFVGMERKSGVRCRNGVVPFADYILGHKSEGMVIIPPGAYFAEGMTLEGVEGLKLYAYGVLHEQTVHDVTAIKLDGCVGVQIKGMFFGHDVYPHTQGTVVYRDDEKTCFVTDPGYRKNFADGKFFGGGAPGFYFKPELLYPECDFLYKKKEYDESKNLNILTEPAKKMSVGDRVAFRTGFGSSAVQLWECSETLLEDVTVFSCSGFAESDKNNNVAPVLHRFAVAAGQSPVLDGNGRYEGFEAVLHRDSYGRLRSAEPLNTSCDATHCTNARHGIQIISCLLERMNDDGGNINAFYGLAESFDAGTGELRFGRCNSRSYRYLPSPVKAGDRILIYAFSGKLLGDVTAENDAVTDDGDNFTVKLSQSITLPEGENVAVQNASASGNGFLIDNTLVRNQGCNGFRIKAIGGEIRNSSFIGLSKGALDCVPEFQLWPECGYAENIKIVKNRFEKLGKTSNLSEESEDCAWCAPINIRYSLWDRGANATFDTNYCLHKNIEISDNVFLSTYSRYEIAISAASNVCIRRNHFDCTEENTEKKYPLLLFGGRQITFDGNTFSEKNGKRVEYRFGRETLAELSGNNLQ